MTPWRSLAAVLLAGACVNGCAPESIGPSLAPVTLSGEALTTPCHSAVVARAEHLRDHGAVGAESLESDIFKTCTYAEFQAANAIMVDRYRYPGDGRTYIGRSCARLFSIYRGSRLCESR